MTRTVDGITVTPGDSFQWSDRPIIDLGYVIYRNGKMVASCPSKRAAKALRGKLNGAASEMRWQECVSALEQQRTATP